MKYLKTAPEANEPDEQAAISEDSYHQLIIDYSNYREASQKRGKGLTSKNIRRPPEGERLSLS